jgi:hypothetical protein
MGLWQGCEFKILMGVRLVVGQRTLDPYAEVRILDPQPDNL